MIPLSESHITISEALPNEYNIIQDIAYKTWPITYGKILSNIQLSYMLELFYSLDALNKNSQDGHNFLLARESQRAIGFASYENGYKQTNKTHIHKIYILPEMQGLGIGNQLMNAIESRAIAANSEGITLNVNRSNPALYFYQKLGFAIIMEIDIELDHGYLMEDYILEKNLLN